MPIPLAGVTPASSFELNGFEPQRGPVPILADDIDPKTGEYRSITRSANLSDATVSYLLSIQRGSGAAVRSFGHRLREIRQVEEQSVELVASYLRQALEPATKSGMIRLDKVTATVNVDDPTQVDPVVQYVDLLERRVEDRNKTFSP